jgi:hypothetical protein
MVEEGGRRFRLEMCISPRCAYGRILAMAVAVPSAASESRGFEREGTKVDPVYDRYVSCGWRADVARTEI